MAPKYTITYHRNHSSSDSTSQQFTQSSSTFTLKTIGELGWEAPSGYIFSTWNSEADGSGMSRDPGNTIAQGNVYAIWEPIPVPYLTTDTELASVADAIRTKGGTSAQLTYPTGFVSAINAIPTGGGGGLQWVEQLGEPADLADFDLTQYLSSSDDDTVWHAHVTDAYVGNTSLMLHDLYGVTGVFDIYGHGIDFGAILLFDEINEPYWASMDAGLLMLYSFYGDGEAVYGTVSSLKLLL